MPKRHNLRHARVRRRLAVRSGAHWLGLAGAGLLLAGGSANANPLGGQVTAGSATIGNSSPAQLDIQQSTDRAVIDWQSFNIAVGERTQFHQPAASSWTLNRVNSPNPSTIAGYLGANGSLVLVNPSGVVFSKGSQVNVNSLIATPSGISNANFMAGKMRFDQPGNPNARVENAGTITVAQKGLAALVAPSVANSGLIQAKLGKVVLAGAATYTLDFYGDGLINFDVGPKVATVPVGPDGKPVKSLVSNTGTIDAAGGTVILTADAVSGILENVIDSPGTISARTTTTPAGSVSFGDIKIDAGEGNQARLGGTLDVSARAPGQRGGTAVVTGGSVRLTETARVYAQGPAGGGKVRIGGGPHGTDTSVRNAQTTVIDAGAVIDASATGNGNGGNIAVWSDGSTTFNGAIYAKGGPNGGNGGWV
ncbi:MAG: filamentous hemagglutinin N-terminal domain-containing protein, partial [Alphaproteobacteria bacterium]|nr:filamentous hemagglutinin N-terminal domain-containing protein [Alphaproteobacteria bacterium]